MIEIPESFAQTIVDREGASGRAWVASLPNLVDEYLQRWECTPMAPVVRGKVGIIFGVKRHDGSPAVLKISFPHPGNVYEPPVPRCVPIAVADSATSERGSSTSPTRSPSFWRDTWVVRSSSVRLMQQSGSSHFSRPAEIIQDHCWETVHFRGQ